MAEITSSKTSARSPRWWPLLLLCVLEAGWLLWVWERPSDQRQQQVIRTAAGILAGFLLLLLWLLAFSRLRWKIRLGVFLFLVLCLAVIGVLFRVSGVT